MYTIEITSNFTYEWDEDTLYSNHVYVNNFLFNNKVFDNFSKYSKNNLFLTFYTQITQQNQCIYYITN